LRIAGKDRRGRGRAARFLLATILAPFLCASAYATTADYGAFLAIQEDLLLRLMDVIESSGTALAFPSQTMYFTRDERLDRERAAAAEATVRQWRERGALPFPDLPADEKATLKGGIEYPPRGSALGDGAARK